MMSTSRTSNRTLLPAALALLTAVMVSGSSDGRPGCPCVGSIDLSDFLISNGTALRPRVNTHVLPADYGLSCKQHDVNGSHCSDLSIPRGALSPAYCSETWCWVNPDNCTEDDVSASSWFPGRANYSYATCRSTTAEDQVWIVAVIVAAIILVVTCIGTSLACLWRFSRRAVHVSPEVEIEVSLFKPKQDSKLGISLGSPKESSIVMVMHLVEGGVAAPHARARPDRRLFKGDVILAVNGQQGLDYRAMSTMFKSLQGDVRLRVRRARPGATESSSAPRLQGALQSMQGAPQGALQSAGAAAAAAAVPGSPAPVVPRCTAKEFFGRSLQKSSGKATAEGCHVWVHREADDFLAPCPFGEYVAEVLRWCGLEAEAETEGGDMVGAKVCIFLLSDNIFSCERSLSLMRRAVDLGKQCVVINMPGAKYVPERDRPRHDISNTTYYTFPENAFNPAWEPHCPELKPIFGELNVTWELEYQHACEQQLFERVARHLQRLLGEEVCDVPEVVRKLEAEEEKALCSARELQPEGVELDWDWGEKVFDAYLSHKIDDAKDIVLTWHTLLSARGYHPFLDRLNLDSVGNIQDFIEESVTVVVAVTCNLFDSYWCAVELCTAARLHAEGNLNILLVPVQGETWEHEGRKFDFPPPAKVMANYGKWFPNLPDKTRAEVARLYGGGSYTESRIIKHTLMHYSSFERMLIARIGPSIKEIMAQKAEREEAAKEASREEQAEREAQPVRERNAREAEAHECTFWFVSALKLLESDESPLPSFQELRARDNDILAERLITQTGSFQRIYTNSYLVVSHRWFQTSEPDEDGLQLEKIRKHLREHTNIQWVWFDFWCMPQGKRTAAEKVAFDHMLSNINFLYLGCDVLILLDLSYLSRFWTQFEAWLSMQICTVNGLTACREDNAENRCTIVPIYNADSSIVRDMIPDTLRAMWADKTPEDAYEILKQEDVIVTNQSDKEKQLPKLQSLANVARDVMKGG